MTPFFYGLLVSLSPCMLPLIPIIYRVIGEIKGTVQYVLGSALSYLILGIMISLVGIHFQNFMHWWPVKISFSLVLTYLALTSWGWCKLPHFTAIESKNPFILGLIAPIICSPCMTPALAVIITTISTHKIKAIYDLLLFGLGVNIPLISMCFGLKKVLDKIKGGNIGKYITWLNGLLLIGLVIYLWV